MKLVHNCVKVDGYEDPELPGEIITFTCSLSGIMPNGPSSSTYMGNGERDPNLMDVNCTGPGEQWIKRLMFVSASGEV